MKKLLTVCFSLLSLSAFADEGGSSFWMPGQPGVLAAVPVDAGWSAVTTLYRAKADASSGKGFTGGAAVTAGLDLEQSLFMVTPTYTFETPVLGGQAAVALTVLGGRVKTGASMILDVPGGTVLEANPDHRVTGMGDLYPMATLKWSEGVNNVMVYLTGSIPTGKYDMMSLAYVGLGHGAVDAGGAYTYFDPDSGHEISVTSGFTYNLRNSDTDYKNGVDFHIDVSASKFLDDQWMIGLAGYHYQQITDDEGSAAFLGGFRSRVTGVGPQVAYTFPVSEKKWTVSLKGFKEFNADNRPEGYNIWLSLVSPF